MLQVVAAVAVRHRSQRAHEPEATYSARVLAQASPILRVGLQDHVHCAVYQHHPVNGTPLQEMSAALGPDFAGLLKIVQAKVPARLRVIDGHQCTTNGITTFMLSPETEVVSNLARDCPSRKGRGFGNDGGGRMCRSMRAVRTACKSRVLRLRSIWCSSSQTLVPKRTLRPCGR